VAAPKLLLLKGAAAAAADTVADDDGALSADVTTVVLFWFGMWVGVGVVLEAWRFDVSIVKPPAAARCSGVASTACR
jgi:hypothetical protein